MRAGAKKLIGYLRGYLLRARVHATGPIKVYGPVHIRNPVGHITIGARTKLYPGVVFDFEAAEPGTVPEVSVGEFSHLGDRLEIHCATRVTIGRNVRISWDVLLLESDYHPSGDARAVSRPIVIEDDAWIGARATVLKGVRVGAGAIVAACAVVTRDVAPRTVVAGNPARVVRVLDAAEQAVT